MVDKFTQVFYSNKSTGRLDYNFDLRELTENFSLIDFVSNARKCPNEDFGGFLICTPKQYIIGYNSNFGTGSHGNSFGRAMKDMQGGGEITSQEEILSLASKCERTYFCGRILYDCRGTNEYGRPIFQGCFCFLTAKPISEKMFKSFKRFYEDYKKEIESVVKNSNGTFDLSYYSKELRKGIHTTNMEEIYDYVEKHVDYEYNPEEEERIIGVGTESQQLI